MLIKKELQEKIRNSPLLFNDSIVEAYEICLLYLKHKKVYNEIKLKIVPDMIDIDELEEKCILFIEQIERKLNI